MAASTFYVLQDAGTLAGVSGEMQGQAGSGFPESLLPPDDAPVACVESEQQGRGTTPTEKCIECAVCQKIVKYRMRQGHALVHLARQNQYAYTCNSCDFGCAFKASMRYSTNVGSACRVNVHLSQYNVFQRHMSLAHSVRCMRANFTDRTVAMTESIVGQSVRCFGVKHTSKTVGTKQDMVIRDHYLLFRRGSKDIRQKQVVAGDKVVKGGGDETSITDKFNPLKCSGIRLRKRERRSRISHRDIRCKKCSSLIRYDRKTVHARFHLGTEQGIFPFKCKVCGVQFLSALGIRKHLQDAHQLPFESQHYSDDSADGQATSKLVNEIVECYGAQHIPSHLRRLAPDAVKQVFKEAECGNDSQGSSENKGNANRLKVMRPYRVGERKGELKLSDVVQCLKCNKLITTKQRDLHVSVHLQREQGIFPFKCNICGSTAAQRGNIRIHIKLVHNVSNVTDEDFTDSRSQFKEQFIRETVACFGVKYIRRCDKMNHSELVSDLLRESNGVEGNETASSTGGIFAAEESFTVSDQCSPHSPLANFPATFPSDECRVDARSEGASCSSGAIADAVIHEGDSDGTLAGESTEFSDTANNATGDSKLSAIQMVSKQILPMAWYFASWSAPRFDDAKCGKCLKMVRFSRGSDWHVYAHLARDHDLYRFECALCNAFFTCNTHTITGHLKSTLIHGVSREELRDYRTRYYIDHADAFREQFFNEYILCFGKKLVTGKAAAWRKDTALLQSILRSTKSPPREHFGNPPAIEDYNDGPSPSTIANASTNKKQRMSRAVKASADTSSKQQPQLPDTNLEPRRQLALPCKKCGKIVTNQNRLVHAQYHLGDERCLFRYHCKLCTKVKAHGKAVIKKHAIQAHNVHRNNDDFFIDNVDAMMEDLLQYYDECYGSEEIPKMLIYRIKFGGGGKTDAVAQPYEKRVDEEIEEQPMEEDLWSNDELLDISV